jgi:cell wall-associated NlpC family hydrolase
MDDTQQAIASSSWRAGHGAQALRDDLRASLDPRRLAVIEEAREWLRTPYHHMGRVKGSGADCLTLLAEVYEVAGVLPHVDVPFYPPDWNLHRDAERYLDGLMQYAREVPPIEVPGSGPGTQPGNVAVFRFGRCFAHGAIVVAWPLLIHAWCDAGVVYGDGSRPPLAGRPVRFFDPFTNA